MHPLEKHHNILVNQFSITDFHQGTLTNKRMILANHLMHFKIMHQGAIERTH